MQNEKKGRNKERDQVINLSNTPYAQTPASGAELKQERVTRVWILTQTTKTKICSPSFCTGLQNDAQCCWTELCIQINQKKNRPSQFKVEWMTLHLPWKCWWEWWNAKAPSDGAFIDSHSSVFNDASLVHLLSDPVDHKDHVCRLRGSVLGWGFLDVASVEPCSTAGGCKWRVTLLLITVSKVCPVIIVPSTFVLL